eukprot:42501_1
MAISMVKLLMLLLILVNITASSNSILTDFYGGPGGTGGVALDQGIVTTISWSQCDYNGPEITQLNWQSPNKTYDNTMGIGFCDVQLKKCPTVNIEPGECIYGHRIGFGQFVQSMEFLTMSMRNQTNSTLHKLYSCGSVGNATHNSGTIIYNGYCLSGFRWRAYSVIDGISFQYTELPTLSPTLAPTTTIGENWVEKIDPYCPDGYTDLSPKNMWYLQYCKRCSQGYAGTNGECSKCKTYEEPNHLRTNCVTTPAWVIVFAALGVFVSGLIGLVFWYCKYRKIRQLKGKKSYSVDLTINMMDSEQTKKKRKCCCCKNKN